MEDLTSFTPASQQSIESDEDIYNEIPLHELIGGGDLLHNSSSKLESAVEAAIAGISGSSTLVINTSAKSAESSACISSAGSNNNAAAEAGESTTANGNGENEGPTLPLYKRLAEPPESHDNNYMASANALRAEKMLSSLEGVQQRLLKKRKYDEAKLDASLGNAADDIFQMLQTKNPPRTTYGLPFLRHYSSSKMIRLEFNTNEISSSSSDDEDQVTRKSSVVTKGSFLASKQICSLSETETDLTNDVSSRNVVLGGRCHQNSALHCSHGESNAGKKTVRSNSRHRHHKCRRRHHTKGTKGETHQQQKQQLLEFPLKLDDLEGEIRQLMLRRLAEANNEKSRQENIPPTTTSSSSSSSSLSSTLPQTKTNGANLVRVQIDISQGEEEAVRQKKMDGAAPKIDRYQVTTTTGYTYHCSARGCKSSFALEDIEEICDHIGGRGIAPLNKDLRCQLSGFFRHFAYRVRLLVNPVLRTVSTKTVVTCVNCPAEFALEEDEKSVLSLAKQLFDHLVSSVQMHQVVSMDYCLFCDRRINARDDGMSRHLAEFAGAHALRLLAMATCHPVSNNNNNNNKVCCKTCGDSYVIDDRLPDWMSRASCTRCLVETNKDAGEAKRNKKQQLSVVLCHFCRQGKFGYTGASSSTSICVNCMETADAYGRLTNRGECDSYVSGMLNELIRQLNANSAPSSPPKLVPQTTLKPSPPATKKVAVVSPEPRSGKRKSSFEDSKSSEKGSKLNRVNPATFSLRQLLTGKLIKEKHLERFQSFSLCGSRTLDALAASYQQKEYQEVSGNSLAYECLHCSKSWPITRANMAQIVGHFSPLNDADDVDDNGSSSQHVSGKHLSKVYDQLQVAVSLKNNNNIGLTSVLRCRKCKFYLPPFSSSGLELVQHAQECFKAKFQRGGSKVCLVCNGKHHQQQMGSSKCVENLLSSLAVNCCRSKLCLKCCRQTNGPAVCQKCLANLQDDNGTLERTADAYSLIFDTFAQADMIEEQIVAAKRQLQQAYC